MRDAKGHKLYVYCFNKHNVPQWYVSIQGQLVALAPGNYDRAQALKLAQDRIKGATQ